MMKAKKYDWKDSNMALFGSDADKKVKKDSAKTEKAWTGAGQHVGVKIWRIVKFKVQDWPKEDYGKFYNGDSYIILNTYKNSGSDQLLYDVHFWIGKYSSQDEYGTAAYKTVELDTFLDDKPIQHREVMGYESALFKTYFPTMEMMKGGAETGFRRVSPEEYKTRLFRFSGERKSIVVTEISAKKDSVTADDIFILDLGLELFQYNGANANKDEKFKATQYFQQLKSDRGGKCKIEVLDGGDTSRNHPFFDKLKDGAPKPRTPVSKGPHKLLRVSDQTGCLDTTLVKEGSISMADLDSKDVFLLDLSDHLFVWVGSGASIDERRNAMAYAHKYLMESDNPFIPVECVAEGNSTGTSRIEKALTA